MPTALGLNVTPKPDWSTAVHWLPARGRTAGLRPVRGAVEGPPAGDTGLNVTSFEKPVVTQRVALAQASAPRPPPGRATTLGVPGDVGSNVTSASPSMATQRVAVGHATSLRKWPAARVTGAGEPGEVGSNVTSSPSPTAVHWWTAGHATLRSAVPSSTATALGVPGEPGSNVSSRPSAVTMVHWVVDAQSNPLNGATLSWSIGFDSD